MLVSTRMVEHSNLAAAADLPLLGDEGEEEMMIEDGGDYDDSMFGDEDICVVDDGTGQSADTNKFDQIVGALTDFMVDETFEVLRNDFCRKNCVHFEDSEENKLIYTQLFEQYQKLVETAIEAELRRTVPGFDMQEFLGMMEARQEELLSEVFDLLLSIADFEAFKEVMLAYKAEAGASAPLFEISVRSIPMHTEEQEDGEHRPDLDFGLSIMSFGVAGKAKK